jgi:hypothetical protein
LPVSRVSWILILIDQLSLTGAFKMFKRIAEFLVAFAVALISIAFTEGRSNDLQPEAGIFSGDAPDPYYLSLREILLGEHQYRLCQMFVVPSSGPEWAVYIFREGKQNKAQVIYKSMKKNLWYEMNDNIEKRLNNGTIDWSAPSQKLALDQLKKSFNRATVPISEPTTVVLEQVWGEMLARVTYPKPKEHVIGFDGVTYHISHWARATGFQSGTTWSPEKGSNTGALVEIAECLQGYVLANSKERPSIESNIVKKSQELLAKLKQKQ